MDMGTAFLLDEATATVPSRVLQTPTDGRIRYGDRLLLKSCASREARFLSIVRRKAGTRVASILHTDVAVPGAYPEMDYIWTFVPAARGKNKLGEPIAFGDAVRLQLFDSGGNYRLMAMSESDPRGVVALRAPCARELSTWWAAGASSLHTDANGRVQPCGSVPPYLQFGRGCYLSLTQAGCYLSVTTGQRAVPWYRIGTLPDWPNTGVPIFWHAYRCAADAERAA